MTSQDLLHERANDAMIQGDSEKALELYKEIIKQNPKDEVALSQLMDLYYEDDKFNYYLTRADLNIASNKYEHAINDCKKALGVDTTSVFVHKKLAYLYVFLNKNLKAIDEFNRILELSPKEEDIYRELADIYQKENSIPSSVETIKHALTFFPDNKEFKNTLAKLYFKEGNLQEALEIVEDEILKIRILLQNEENEKAKNILDNLEINKNNKEPYYSLMAQYFYNTNDMEKSLENVNKFIELNKTSPLGYQMSALIYEKQNCAFEASLNWGYCSKYQGKDDEAIMHFERAHGLNPKSEKPLFELVHLYESKGDKFLAIEFWQKIYELNQDAKAKKILADFYYSQGDFRLAEKYGKIIEKKQKNVSNKSYDNAPFEEDEGIINKILNLFSKK